MFYGLRDRFERFGRYFKTAAFFVVLVCMFLVCTIGYFRYSLREYCLQDVQSRLDEYVDHRLNTIRFLEKSESSFSGLGGLSFIRMVRGEEQYFITDHPKFDFDLSGLVTLQNHNSLIWVPLDETNGGNWVIATREVADGFIIQAGKEYPLIRGLYSKLLTFAWITLFLGTGLSCLLSLFIRKASLASVKEAEVSLNELIDNPSSILLDKKNNPELQDLYTALNKVVQQNRMLVKEMQQSLDNVAHDLRTPMTRLRSVAEYGLQKKNQESLENSLADCLEESERVLSMLGIMMSVAEAEAGTMHLKKEKLQLLETITDVTSLYEYVAEDKNISFQTDIDQSFQIDADRTRIEQVWANVIDNGIKYGKKGGYVKIIAHQDDNILSISFSDNGMGISESERDRIWERLFRGDRSRTEQGLGLGLNYVRAVIEAHGGTIMVESELGKGSSFIVQLPALST